MNLLDSLNYISPKLTVGLLDQLNYKSLFFQKCQTIQFSLYYILNYSYLKIFF